MGRNGVKARGRGWGTGEALAWLGCLGAGSQDAYPGAEAAVERRRHRGSRSCSRLGRRRRCWCGCANGGRGLVARVTCCDLSRSGSGFEESGFWPVFSFLACYLATSKRPSPGSKACGLVKIGIRLSTMLKSASASGSRNLGDSPFFSNGFELDCRSNHPSTSIPFSMESLASQARPAAVLWLAGFLEAARLHRVISFCARFSAFPCLPCYIDFWGCHLFFWRKFSLFYPV